MKPTLLYICTLLFISFAGIGQKQVTDLITDKLSDEYGRYVGRIENDIYFFASSEIIKKYNLKTSTSSEVIRLMPNFQNSEAVIVDEKLFVYQSFGGDAIYQVNISEGKLKREIDFSPSNEIFKSIDGLFVKMKDSSVYTIDLRAEKYTLRKCYQKLLEGKLYPYHCFTAEDLNGKKISGFHTEFYHFYPKNYSGTPMPPIEFENYIVHPFAEKYGPWEGENYVKYQIYIKNASVSNLLEHTISYKHTTVSFFELGEELFILSNSPSSINDKPNIYCLYKLSNQQTNLVNCFLAYGFHTYNLYGMIANYKPYSSPVIHNNNLYFWVSENEYENPDKMELVVANLSNGSVKQIPLSNTEFEENYVSPPPYYLEVSDSLIISTSIGVRPTSLRIDSNQFVSSDLVYPITDKSIKLNDSLYADFSLRNYMVFFNMKGDLLGKETISYQKGAYDDLHLMPESIFLLNSSQKRIDRFDGGRIIPVPLDFADLGNLNGKSYFLEAPIEGHILFVDYNETLSDEGEMVYVYLVDLNNSNASLIYKEELSNLNSYGYLFMNSTLKDFVVFYKGEGIYHIVNLRNRKSYDFVSTHKRRQKGDRFVAALQNRALIFKEDDYASSIKYVYFNPETGRKRDLEVTGNYDMVNSKNYIYILSNMDIKRVDIEGNVVNISDKLISNIHTKTHIYYLGESKVGKIDLETNEIEELDLSQRSGSIFFHPSESSLFTIGMNREIYKVDFNLKNVALLNNEAFNSSLSYQYGTDTQGRRNGYILTTENNKNVLWSVRKDRLQKVIESDHSLNVPTSHTNPTFLYRSTEGTQLILDPDSLSITELRSDEFIGLAWFVYLFRTSESIYFQAWNPDNNTYPLFEFNTKSNKIDLVLINDTNIEYQSFKMLNDAHFIYNKQGVWKLQKGEALNVSEGLVLKSYEMVTFYEFKNNLFIWAYDKNGFKQLWQLTDNEPKDDEGDILLSSENLTINFSFYPNPTQDFLNVSSTSATENRYKITVFSTDGKVLSEQILELPQKLDLSSLKEGTYLINVRDGKENKTFRVVKQ